MKKTSHSCKHKPDDISKAISLFFNVRGIVRTRLAQGVRLNPSAWLRIETLKFIHTHTPRMGEVAEHLSITAPSATSLVRGLVKSGLVEMRKDPTDGRSACLALTSAGKRELARTIKRGQRILSDLFGVLSKDELAAFIRALERMRDL